MPLALDTPGLDATIQRMDSRLAELAASGDRRERFLLMYRTFKTELRQNLRDGRFRDSEWAEAICCRMGEMYFEADVAYQTGEDCPAPWTRAFDSARRRRTNLLQDMLLGMNAHINYDLPFCTFDTMRRFGDVEELRRGARSSLRFRQLLRRRYHDFLLINEIAWESIPLIQDVVCDRFNRLLKYANILSFRFSRPVAERLICEYRDRAWAHTLVLLTADDQHAGATRRHISLFALRASTLVERLSINPLRHLRRNDGVAHDPASLDAVAHTLVDHLGQRPTRAVARQALIEYGAEVQPVLIRILDRAPPLPRVRAEVYGILAARPGLEALRALAAALPREQEARHPLLRALADLADAGRVPAGALEPLMAVARAEHAIARRLLSLAAGLGPEDRRASLLGRALREHAHRALCRARLALRAAQRPPALALPECEDALAPLPSLESLRRAGGGIAAAVGESSLEAEPPTRPEMLEPLLAHPDEWIRACAAWWAGDGSSGAEAVIARLKVEDHELVKETALAALRRGQPPARLREAAELVLGRRTYTPDTPARRLAGQILEGEVTMMTTIEKVLHLKNVELFRDVLAEDLVTIARVAEEHRFALGDALIRSREPGVATYVVVEGTVEVRGLDGQELARVGPGGVLGEMSVVSDMPTSADCIATTAGLSLRIAREDFHALLQDHPTTAIGVMHVLAQRLRNTNRKAGAGAAVPLAAALGTE